MNGLRDDRSLSISVCLPTGRSPSQRTRRRLKAAGLTASLGPEGIGDSGVVLSLVTPAAALEVARAVAPHLRPGAIYVDMNAVSGGTAADIATLVQSHGARFVDAAVMGPVPLMKLRVPISLSGEAARAFHRLAERHGLETSVLSSRSGDASSLKMLWSIITKGTIALFAEALIAAHRLRLTKPMVKMLRREYGYMGSPAMIVRLLASTTVSGRRRLSEMDEVRKVLAEASVPAWTVESTEEWIAELSKIAGAGNLKNVDQVINAVSTGLNRFSSRPARVLR